MGKYNMSKKDFLFLILLNTIWGSAFAVSGYTMLFFSPLFLYAIRFFLTGLATVPFNIFPKKAIKKIFILSTLQTVIFCGVSLGIKNLDSAISAILIKLDIPFTMILASIFLKEKLTKQMLVGIFICFSAIYFLSENISFYNLKFILILILSSLVTGFSNVYIKSIKEANNNQIVSWSCIFIGVEMFLVSLFFENTFILKDINIKVILIVLYLSIVSGYLAYLILYYLLKKYETSKIMPYNFLRPIIAIFAGYFILNEEITLNKILGCLMILIGIYITENKTNLYEKIKNIFIKK